MIPFYHPTPNPEPPTQQGYPGYGGFAVSPITPAPLAAYRPARAVPWRGLGIASLAFVVTSLLGGVWLGMRMAAVQIDNAQNAQKQAEQRLQAMQTKIDKFCDKGAN